MRILVYAKSFGVGGSQTVSVRLAIGTHRLGHEVVMLSTPGPLARVASEAGVRVITDARAIERRGSVRAIRSLHDVVARVRPDLVHAYDGTRVMQALYGAHLAHRIPILASVTAMRTPWYLPAGMTITVPTPRKVQDFQRRWPPEHVFQLPPPVDTEHHTPGFDASSFVERHDLDPAATTVVLVSRLVAAFKREGIERTLDAVGALAGERRVQLVIVGDGELRDSLTARADELNRHWRRRVVLFTGELVDPRPAYAAADIVVGVGIAVLDGMAHAKPAIALGREGYSEIVDPSSIEVLAQRGFYGLGDTNDPGSERLRDQLRQIIDDGAGRHRLGQFARRFVSDHYGVELVARTLVGLYEDVRSRGTTTTSLVDAALTPARLARYRWVEARLRKRAEQQGDIGDRSDSAVYLALADRLASKPATSGA